MSCLAFGGLGLVWFGFGPILQLRTANIPFQSQQELKNTEHYTVSALESLKYHNEQWLWKKNNNKVCFV